MFPCFTHDMQPLNICRTGSVKLKGSMNRQPQLIHNLRRRGLCGTSYHHLQATCAWSPFSWVGVSDNLIPADIPSGQWLYVSRLYVNTIVNISQDSNFIPPLASGTNSKSSWMADGFYLSTCNNCQVCLYISLTATTTSA